MHVQRSQPVVVSPMCQNERARHTLPGTTQEGRRGGALLDGKLLQAEDFG